MAKVELLLERLMADYKIDDVDKALMIAYYLT